MSRPQLPHIHAITARDGSMINIAETQGYRPSMQDAILAGYARDRKALENPEDFLEETLGEISAALKDCRHGSTACGAIARKTAADNLEITLANLGDSRATLIIRHKNGDYEAISLTEDHSLESPRIRAFVTSHGGTINEVDGVLRLNNLNMGGALGDCEIGPGLLRGADILHYQLKDFLRAGETMDDIQADLVLACDGLFDLGDKKDSMGYTRGLEMKHVSGGIVTDFPAGKAGFEADGIPFHMARLKYLFDRLTPVDAKRFDSFAQYLVYVALTHGASSDNISVVHVPLVDDGDILLHEEKPVIAAVFDGHGTTPLHPGTHDHVPHPDSLDLDKPLADSDGAVVSSLAAFILMLKANMEHIPGLDISQTQPFLKSLIQKNTPSSTVTAPGGAAAMPITTSVVLG